MTIVSCFLNCEAQYLKWTCFTAKPGLVILWLNIYYINIFIDFYCGFLQHLECPNRSPLRSWDYMVSNLVILVVSFVISKKTLGCLTFFLCVYIDINKVGFPIFWFRLFLMKVALLFQKRVVLTKFNNYVLLCICMVQTLIIHVIRYYSRNLELKLLVKELNQV